MDLTALVEEHSRRAAAEGPVTFALLQAMRYLQDGRNFVEGDFREWIAEGQRLHSEAQFERAVAESPFLKDIREGRAVQGEAVTITTGDDDRPPDDMARVILEHRQQITADFFKEPPTLTPAQQRMAKARAAKAARKGAA
jgi:hypothetical protein